MNTSLESKLATKLDILRDRGDMMALARSFFAERDILEVDCPLLSKGAPIELHIDIMTTSSKRYLHSSPEYGMKRLLSMGIGDIYQLSHVYREGESGKLHNPEFTMIEWYRTDTPFETFIAETIDFLRLFLGPLPASAITYRHALDRFAKNAPMPKDIEHWDEDTRLNYLLAFFVEPYLGKDEITALTYYPASQAALAQTRYVDGELVAERFELYYQGIEIANGYHELADSKEQRRRLEEANLERQKRGKQPLPIDENFLKALDIGLPDCCGVAVGFDRLMMLRHQRDTLAEVLPFSWDEA